MSNISKKQARAIATTIADDLFEEQISQLQVEMAEVMTVAVQKAIPSDVFDFIRKRPKYIQTTRLASVCGNIDGKYAYYCGYVKTPIPYYPLSIEVDEEMLLPIKEIGDRMRDLREKRSVIRLDVLGRIYKCGTIARLEKEYPEAYKILVKIEAGEVFKHC